MSAITVECDGASYTATFEALVRHLLGDLTGDKVPTLMIASVTADAVGADTPPRFRPVYLTGVTSTHALFAMEGSEPQMGEHDWQVLFEDLVRIEVL